MCFDNAKNQAYTAILNLSSSSVVSVDLAPAGSQPTMSIDEQIECEQAVLADPAFQAAIKKHYGISDPSLVMVDIWRSS